LENVDNCSTALWLVRSEQNGACNYLRLPCVVLGLSLSLFFWWLLLCRCFALTGTWKTRLAALHTYYLCLQVKSTDFTGKNAWFSWLDGIIISRQKTLLECTIFILLCHGPLFLWLVRSEENVALQHLSAFGVPCCVDWEDCVGFSFFIFHAVSLLHLCWLNLGAGKAEGWCLGL
jgi:hypothetical protein